MTTLVSRNTIKLGGSASSISGYYNGYTIIVTRISSISGKEETQKKGIISYDGATKIATIDGLWDLDFIPKPTDKYKIVPTYADSRVSINPAIQTMDYITSKVYGRGLDHHKDLKLESWLESARLCDTQSDITVKVTNIAGLMPGAVYRYIANGVFHFQGTVKSINENYVRFTKVIGKLANKWNSWKYWQAGTIIYDGTRTFIKVSAGEAPINPAVNASGFTEISSTMTLTKHSGTGPSNLTVVTKGNPVRSINERGLEISGYSLYDSDGIDYWRYLGWDQHDQRFVTRHQTNITIDTSQTLFDNTNGMLEHFGGILRYSSGKYSLEVETGEPSIPNTENEPRNITDDVLIGKIRLSDAGIRSSFNSLTVAYADPANKYEAKNISFFNSVFLKSDRNVPKKGNLSIPGVTNYYNARLLADKFLAKSRYGLTISFNMSPRGVLLFAGRVIQVQNERYGWVNKKFRIENVTHNPDTTVDIVAKEYDDSMYVISNLSRPPASALAAEANIATNSAPGGLRTTSIDSQDETVGGIELSWNNHPSAGYTSSVELYGATKTNLFVTVAGISGATLTANEPHNLTTGDWVTSYSGEYGLQNKKTYYVKSVPTPTTFTLASSSELPAIVFTTGVGLDLKLMTASIITTVPFPGESYIDVVPGQGSQRIERFYWIRHKYQG